MNPVISSSQLTLDFLPGLTERYPSALDCLRASAYSSNKPLKAIAADMDISQSDLSRKLANNPDDPRRFTVQDLEAFIVATGDTTVVRYFAQKYLADPDIARREALAELARLAPQLQALVKAAGVSHA